MYGIQKKSDRGRAKHADPGGTDNKRRAGVVAENNEP